MCLFLTTPFFQTANVVFFVLTSKQLYESWKFTRSQLKNETSSGNTAVSTIRICPRRQNANQNFKVILKLFVVMGITHFSELIGKDIFTSLKWFSISRENREIILFWIYTRPWNIIHRFYSLMSVNKIGVSSFSKKTKKTKKCAAENRIRAILASHCSLIRRGALTLWTTRTTEVLHHKLRI